MTDSCVSLEGMSLQHGPRNNRVYLMDMGNCPEEKAVRIIHNLARENHYTKIFAKVPASKTSAFLSEGFCQEAEIPGFFRGKENNCLLCHYLDPHRSRIPAEEQPFHALLPYSEHTQKKPNKLSDPLILRLVNKNEIPSLAHLYGSVFPCYPFPVHDPEYLRQTLDHVVYLGAFTPEGKLVGAASGEMDLKHKNAEATDFAVDPKFRGRSLASRLLKKLEEVLIERGILTAYTIARLREPAMNATFAKAGYTFSGTLINNTHIMSGIESMNVWYKGL